MRLTDLRSAVTLKALWPIALLAVLGACMFVFLELAEEIMEGEGLYFD